MRGGTPFLGARLRSSLEIAREVNPLPRNNPARCAGVCAAVERIAWHRQHRAGWATPTSPPPASTSTPFSLEELAGTLADPIPWPSSLVLACGRRSGDHADTKPDYQHRLVLAW
ncbi:hypothetical protein [Sphaerotilus sp.]|uniref:hypothetical protein n=1 Tax=Sphaerotilus sp. TaxID=2093942 RepID=UPI0034E2AC71